jgi:hypothetical protein
MAGGWRIRRPVVVGFIALIVLVLGIAGWILAGYASRSPAESAVTAHRIGEIAPPAGYISIKAPASTFADWLVQVPLKPGRAIVRLYNGLPKIRQDVHYAVLDIDTGDANLQQCADSIMRLRAEYLYKQRRYRDIHFCFTSGDRADFSRWAEGYRPGIAGNKVTWIKTARADRSYASLRKYLDSVFAYAGTASLARELRPVPRLADMQIGDVFIRPGFPGHAEIVVAMAQHPRTGARVFLLAQGYMPAQDMHVVRNLNDKKMSPWYPVNFGNKLMTPEYTFTDKELMRFP